MMLTGAYADLWRFAADLASAETAVILDQLSLAQGPQRQVELQARLSCIRQPDEALPA
jgi:Tfp pilus assembly protein PilO